MEPLPDAVVNARTIALLAADGRLLAVAEGREGRWHPMVVLEPAA